MSPDKVSLRAPAKQSSENNGIASPRQSGAHNDKIDPQVLLEDLREKQALFAQLKKEGLIHQDNHLVMEQKLRKTILELEDLIPQLETA